MKESIIKRIFLFGYRKNTFTNQLLTKSCCAIQLETLFKVTQLKLGRKKPKKKTKEKKSIKHIINRLKAFLIKKNNMLQEVITIKNNM